MNRHRGHAHLAHAYTIAHTDSQSDFCFLFFDLEFFKLKKKEGNGFMKLINCSGSASQKGAPFVLQCFFCINVPVLGKPSEHGKKTFPFPSHSQHLAPRPQTLPTGASRALNFTGISIKETRVTIMAEIPQVSPSQVFTLSGGDHKRFLIVSYPSREESNSRGSVTPPSSL